MRVRCVLWCRQMGGARYGCTHAVVALGFRGKERGRGELQFTAPKVLKFAVENGLRRWSFRWVTLSLRRLFHCEETVVSLRGEGRRTGKSVLVRQLWPQALPLRPLYFFCTKTHCHHAHNFTLLGIAQNVRCWSNFPGSVALQTRMCVAKPHFAPAL